ncbi:CDP-alcohol phosphatidyltransferase family protein [Atopomonas sediminilitoris]|uniref:CDP-alcohol phosphatidyltransferase family protein n=1 Tax=Atopomonas sediminilitoris TaxID=2919919 RepID=UPI001F4E3C7D|nr:CDP-alcohol phosphatidyltransferase family protein [Atopomonas sediminilitoris]MCJ8169127.1 CDP-alcohol phosphatidyltransferase family protein [Atopomonas sediminilitoris]
MSAWIIHLNRVDALTLSGIVTSTLAAALALGGAPLLAIACLFIAMLGDALDGIWARRLGITRVFGRYLDGFLDTFIYLAVPALVFWQLGFSGAWAMGLWPLLMAGVVRLAVFNDIGNIDEGSGLAYLGMPVFWSIFLLAGFALLTLLVPQWLANSLLALCLLAFSAAMLWRRAFFKFKRLSHILALTLGGALLFCVLHGVL